jgi:hypothetical protein
MEELLFCVLRQENVMRWKINVALTASANVKAGTTP